MTLQQLEYIVSLDNHRHFVNASRECGIAQPTLSTMIRKLEEELGVAIFDRDRHPVCPTPLGARVIRQARTALAEIGKIGQMVSEQTSSLTGSLRIGIIPTVAPYLVPGFIGRFTAGYPDIELSVCEMRTQAAVRQLKDSLLDMAVVSTPLDEDGMLEIPLYYERFMAYFPPGEPCGTEVLEAGNMPTEGLWVLEEGHCARDQIFNFCRSAAGSNRRYAAGSFDTLVKIVDANGGYTLIPELHLPFLGERQRQNVREIDSPPAVREISLLIRKDYIREGIVNAVADTVKSVIPNHMIDSRLKKFAIRL